jgi:hypothetical protein
LISAELGCATIVGHLPSDAPCLKTVNNCYDNSVGITTVRSGRPRNQSSIPDRVKTSVSSAGCGTHPASYTVGTIGSSVANKIGPGSEVKLTTHVNLLMTYRMVELHLHSPIRLSGIVRN